MTLLNRIFFLLLAMSVVVPIADAFALDLAQAKQQGLLGETPSGYLASVKPAPSKDVTALMNDINAKRKAHYQRIAKENGTAVAAVEKLAAKKAIEKTPSGQFVQLPTGQWQQVE